MKRTILIASLISLGFTNLALAEVFEPVSQFSNAPRVAEQHPRPKPAQHVAATNFAEFYSRSQNEDNRLRAELAALRQVEASAAPRVEASNERAVPVISVMPSRVDVSIQL